MKKIEGKCLACGNNQINHLEEYIQSTLTIYLEPIIEFIMNNTLLKSIMNLYITLFIFLFKISMPILSFFKIVIWNTDIEKCTSIRSKVIWKEALKRNIKIKQLVVFGEYSEIFEVEIKGKRHLFKSLPKPPSAKESGDLWLDDKYILKQKLLEKNISVPKGGSATTIEEARQIFEKIIEPVIVKPRLGSRGRHTTTNINNLEDLKKAFHSAKMLSKFVVIEEHLLGSVYRGTIVDGEVVGILEGMPPRVVGDGVSSIKELILNKNNNKKEPIKDVIVNEYLIEFLKRQNLTLQSVLDKNIEIDLLEKLSYKRADKLCVFAKLGLVKAACFCMFV